MFNQTIYRSNRLFLFFIPLDNIITYAFASLAAKANEDRHSVRVAHGLVDNIKEFYCVLLARSCVLF